MVSPAISFYLYDKSVRKERLKSDWSADEDIVQIGSFFYSPIKNDTYNVFLAFSILVNGPTY